MAFVKFYKKACWLIIFLSWYSFSGNSQDLFPESGFLYDDAEIPRIDITIDPGYLETIFQEGNEQSDFEYPATFKMTRGTEVKIEENIGFRLRGNTSRYSAKKSFKVSMNTFTQGNTFQGVEKINLNGEHNDPSIARAKISWELFRLAGVPAPRANHVELYINGEYRGLYLNVEHIDEEFVDLRFGNNDGNLYKCLWPADLVYLGSNPDLYKFEREGRRAYELKRNEELDDYSDLADFIDILNNTDPAEFPEKLEPVFNVSSYLKNLVVEIMTGHWDAYAYNKNNYYLYKNEETGKFEFIPYDPDNTFGIDWFGEDWANRNIYEWSHPWEERPLTEKILQNSIYRDQYSFYMNRFLENYFNSSYLDPLTDEIRNKIAPFAIDDIYRTQDYGYDYDDFYNSFETAAGDHVKYGIRPYIESRRQSALAQLEEVNIAPVISTVRHNKPGIADDIIITALIEDENVPEEVFLYYSAGEGFSSIRMQATGNEIYRAIIPGLSEEGTLFYYITATDNISQSSREPYSGSLEINISLAVAAPDYLTENSIIVYPNPASDWFIIKSANPFNRLEYRLLDLSGKQILSGESNENPVHVDLYEDMKDGLYILQVILKDRAGKIIKKEYSKIVF